jgi:hypothetical protein
MTTSTQLGLHRSYAVVPFLSSSITLFYAIVKPTIFIPFVRAAETDRVATNRVLRRWFNNFSAANLSTILSITIPTIITGGYALRRLPASHPDFKLYAAGTALALGHFAFAKPIVETINKICDDEVEKKGGNVEWLKRWLWIHAWRTVLTDLPSAVCFASLVFGSQKAEVS